MKIFHVIPSLDPAGGGPPVVAARLAAAQAAQACQTRLIAYLFPKAQKNVETDFRTIPNIEKVAIDYLPPLTKWERFMATGARRKLMELLEPADIVHLHGVWDPIIRAAADAAFELKRPYVLTVHGMLDPWSMSQKAWKKKIALQMGYRRMLDHTAFLHFLNSDEQALTADLHLNAPPRVVPNGIFLEELDPLPAEGEFRANRPWLGDRPFVLFLARLHYKKGMDYLADAFAIVAKKFPDAQLVVAGPDMGAQKPFEEQIRQLNIADRVHLIGPIYGPEKLRALVDCDCFVLPSRQEGFSIAVTEAMACRAPVVVSKSCHFPEVEQAGAGIITELDAAQIAAGINTVLGDPAAAKRMGEAGRELVLSRFTWPQVARQMIEAYEDVLGKKPAPLPAVLH
jgi:glycosyltransferase involved in cell wall biosynthesis